MLVFGGRLSNLSDKDIYYDNYMTRKELLFPALETDYESELTISEENSLLQICMDRLLSDVAILRCFENRIPNSLKLKLLDRAIDTNRVLSIKFLLENYPSEELLLPIPEYMKNCALLVKRNIPVVTLKSKLSNIKDALLTTLSAFQTVISEDKPDSKWRILNLNDMPQVVSVIMGHLQSLNENSNRHKQYVLKGSFMFLSKQDYENFIEFRNNTNIKLVINGIYTDNAEHIELLIDILNKINTEDLKFLSVHFVDNKFPLLLSAIRRFKNLNSLLLTYNRGLVSRRDTRTRRDTLEHFGRLLYELPRLRNLSVKCSRLTHQLKTLLTKNCKIETCTNAEKESEPEAKKLKSSDPDLGCCVLHRGNLQYLDVSGCGLTNADLQCLLKESFCKNIRHLSMGQNEMLTMEKIIECVRHMTSTLVTLDIHSAFKREVGDLSPFIELIEKCEAIRFIVLGPTYFPEKQFARFGQALLSTKYLKRIQEVQVDPFADVDDPSPTLDQINSLKRCLVLKKGAFVDTSVKYYQRSYITLT